VAPLLLALALATAPAPAADGRRAVLGALEEELARSVARLRIDGYDAPYFLAFQVKELRTETVAARHGALFEDEGRRARKASVDLRVGSYDRDSSGRDDAAMFLGQEGQTWYASKEAPLEDDPAALRNTLWLLADERYKEALSAWFKKKSRGVYRTEEPDRAPSFSREEPQRRLDPATSFALDRGRWRAEVKRLSAAFRSHPALFDSSVRVSGDRTVRWLATSEGTALVTEETLYGVHLHAVARAVDGQLLESGRDFYARSEAGLPSPARLREEQKALCAELEALRTAPVVDPSSGPALLAPEATGVLFHEAVGHRLEGERQEDDKEGQTFKGQVGRLVLPAFLSVRDDPTLSRAGDTDLNGSYRFDDQGVPAQAAVLVEDGVLRGYLLSRRPVKPFARSNGHGRAQGVQAPVARMGNLVMTSKRTFPVEELRRMLVAEARRQGKAHAYVVHDIAGGNTNTASFGYQAFKGTPRVVTRIDVATGAEELVRGVELVGTPLSSVNKLIATSDVTRVFNGFCGAESGYVPVSTVAPWALVSELELQRVARAHERSPVLPAPWIEER
jgi:TldD protein